MVGGQNVKFPEYREELLGLLAADQQQIIYQVRNNQEVSQNEGSFHDRAERMLQIMDEIKTPTISNIGADGSQAVSLLALHSYVDVMEKILKLFEIEFVNNPDDIYYQAIPSLKDRLLIIGGKNQLFGTQWYQSADGKPFLFPVEDFEQMNEQRAKYGLDPAVKPTNLATGDKPLGDGIAVATDQKIPTTQEFKEYSAPYIRRLVWYIKDMSEVINDNLPHETIPVSESLTLRQLQPQDSEQIFALVDTNREYLAKWLPWANDTQSSQDSEQFISLMLESRRNGSEYGYGIVQDGQLVGHTSLMNLNDNKEPEIGYWIASSASGKGITTEVAGALTDFGFATLGLQKIVIKADQENIASNKVAEKLGYTIERTELDRYTGQPANVWSKTNR